MWEWLIGFLQGNWGTLILTALIALLGVRWVQLKSLISEVTDLLESVDTAISDDKLTKEELQKILSEFTQVLEAAKGLLGKARASWL